MTGSSTQERESPNLTLRQREILHRSDKRGNGEWGKNCKEEICGSRDRSSEVSWTVTVGVYCQPLGARTVSYDSRCGTLCTANLSEQGHNKKRRLERQEDPQANSMQCIGILPGLGTYADSSDSEQSSDTDQETVPTLAVDLLGRKIVQAVLKNKSSSGSGRDKHKMAVTVKRTQFTLYTAGTGQRGNGCLLKRTYRHHPRTVRAIFETRIMSDCKIITVAERVSNTAGTNDQ
uniref:Uncharacterized protein n=1 Tax=Timema douglasi TaxID=61478 RepID=A0A7R8W1M6_TIMDO|nr:unnamed protein product [Timema douglasi]